MAADSPVFLRHLRLHQSRLPIYHPLTKKRSFSFPGFGYRVQHCMGQCLLCSDCRVWLRVRADLHFLPPSSSLHVVLIPHSFGAIGSSYWAQLCWDYPAMSLITLASCLRQFIYTGPRSSSEGFGFVLLQSSFHILFINIFGDIVHPFFSWRIVPSNVWKRCHCCSLICSFGIFKTMHQAYDAVFLRKRPFLALQAVVGGALRCICIFVPFIAFQAYGYNNLCLGHLPSDMRPWCKARVPLLYNYIQSHHWLLLVSYPSALPSIGFRRI